MSNLLEAYNLFHEGILTLAEIENNGVRVDIAHAKEQEKIINEKLKKIETSIWESEAGVYWKNKYKDKASIISNPQLADVLYEHLKLWPVGFSKKEKPKTDKNWLSKINHPLCSLLLEYKKWQKIDSTYIKPLYVETDENGYIHPSFALNLVESFRSCVAEGSVISMPFGDKNIEDVEAGDLVYSFDDDLNICIKKVLWAGKTGYREVIKNTFSNGENTFHLKTTPEHRIRIKDGNYLQSIDLNGEEILSMKNGEKHIVKCYGMVRTMLPIMENVYDLEVEDTHCFIANKICVHNSGQNPNLQNQAIRDPESAKIIRGCYIPPEGYRIVEIDHAALEIRASVFAHKDPTLAKYIVEDFDMHSLFTRRVYMISEEHWNYISKEHDKLKSNIRYAGKNRFSFSLQYGNFHGQIAVDLWKSLDELKLMYSPEKTLKEYLIETILKSDLYKECICLYNKDHSDFERNKHLLLEYMDIDISNGLGSLSEEDQARACYMQHIKRTERWYYEEQFPVFNQWKKDFYSKYLEKGFFDNLTGFRYKGVYSKNQTLNFPIQSIGFHCLLWALIELQKEIKKRKMKTRIFCEIHDAIEACVPVNELDEFCTLAHDIMVTKTMEHFKFINIPLETDVDVCPVNMSWYYKMGKSKFDNILKLLKNGEIEETRKYIKKELKHDDDVIDKIIENEMKYIKVA